VKGEDPCQPSTRRALQARRAAERERAARERRTRARDALLIRDGLLAAQPVAEIHHQLTRPVIDLATARQKAREIERTLTLLVAAAMLSEATAARYRAELAELNTAINAHASTGRHAT
jgi:hypothetical protein